MSHFIWLELWPKHWHSFIYLLRFFSCYVFRFFVCVYFLPADFILLDRSRLLLHFVCKQILLYHRGDFWHFHHLSYLLPEGHSDKNCDWIHLQQSLILAWTPNRTDYKRYGDEDTTAVQIELVLLFVFQFVKNCRSNACMNILTLSFWCWLTEMRFRFSNIGWRCLAPRWILTKLNMRTKLIAILVSAWIAARRPF